MKRRYKLCALGAVVVVSACAGYWLILDPPCGDHQRTINALRELLSSQNAHMVAHLEKVRSEQPPDEQDREALAAFREKQHVPLATFCQEFDANCIFDVLSHLSMEPGFKLDYVYCAAFEHGFPVLYARREHAVPFKDYAAYRTQLGEELNEARSTYLLHVKTDDTQEGFLQLVILSVMGDQFYLYWHANYNDSEIVCDRSGLEAILSTDHFNKRLPASVRWKARCLRTSPEIRMAADSVSVSVVLFSKWNGCTRYTVERRRSFPHAVIEETTTELAAYSCQVLF